MKRAGSLLLGLVLAACAAEPAPEWVEADGYRWRELVVPSRGAAGFERVSESRTGIDVSNDVRQEDALANRHLTHGSGVALGDVDGDGAVDVFIARIQGPDALFLNRGDWRFEEVTEAARVGGGERSSTGATFGDIDGDGDLDLLVAALGGPNVIHRNDGSGVFSTEELPSTSGSTTLALADIEGDGDLDLYVTNYKVRSAMDRYSPQERAFDTVVEQTEGGYRVREVYAEDFRVFEREDLGRVIYVQRAEEDVLYLNDGSGVFAPESWTEGRFLDEDGLPLSEPPDLFGLSARFYDVTGDGAPELYVANDFEDPDQFWVNDGEGTFRAIDRLAVRQTSNAAMAVDFADVDRDGDVDVFEVDMLSRDRRLRMTQNPTHTMLPKQIGAIDDRPQVMKNALFLNRGDATFAEVSEFAGLAASEWSWGTTFLDVDLDGYEDLLVATGHAWDIMDSDTQRRLGSLGHDWREEFLLFPPLDRPNVAFRNGGSLGFEEVGVDWGFAGDSDISHGLATGDLDGDGDADAVVTRLDAPALLLRNRTTAPRVLVRLVGDAPNTAGVGAVIRLTGGDLPDQEKEVSAGGLYLSDSDDAVTFAAGDGPLTLTVRWRSGARTLVEGVRADRAYEIREDGASDSAPPATDDAPPLFVDVSDGLSHVHHEDDFDDEARQPLLPARLSREGPGLTWHDWDADGDADLLVTSGRGGRVAAFRNEGGSFTERSVGGGEAGLDQTAVLPIPSSTGFDLVLGRSSYEASSPAEAFGAAGVVRWAPDSGEGASLVAGDTTAVGPLAAADVDADGDLDLFVGGRAVPALYPLSTGSRLMLRNGESWSEGPDAGAFGALGMVTSATFSDVDGDGDPDLIVATEWGPVTLLLNESGRFRRAGPEWGLEQVGRWTSVATGDFDGDGRPDLIVTSFGENVADAPTRERPLSLYAADLDRSGSLDLLLARPVPELGGAAPLDRLPRLAAALPALGRTVTSFEQYGSATIEELFGAVLSTVEPRVVPSYAHRLLLNRGGRFEEAALPIEAQLSAAMHAGVADLDGDGSEDVFLSQNFFPTGPERPRLDGGRGLWLRGDGQGGFTAVSGAVSGIAVYGDGRGAAFADFDADGRVDLAVGQNGAHTRLFRNIGAEVGLRVRLRGTAANPSGVGAQIRVVGDDGAGPVREVKLGSGRWSVDDPVQVMGGRASGRRVWVRWPDGSIAEYPIPEGAVEVVLEAPGGSLAPTPDGAQTPAP